MRRFIGSSRYIVLIAIVSIFGAALALLIYEAVVVLSTVAKVIFDGQSSAKASKALAAGLIEAIDIFLISIVAYITSVGLYSLFLDDDLPLPQWLAVRNLDDLKGQLVSVIIAVLAVMFLQEMVARSSELDLLSLAASISLITGALTFFLALKFGNRRE